MDQILPAQDTSVVGFCEYKNETSSFAQGGGL